MKTWKWIWLCCAVVASGCHAVSRKGRATLELYPAEESSSQNWRCRDYNGRCVLLAPEPVARINAPRFEVVAGERPAISIHLEPAQQLALASAGGVPRRLALVVDGRVHHVARLRGPLTGDALMLSFCNQASLSRVVDALLPEA